MITGASTKVAIVRFLARWFCLRSGCTGAILLLCAGQALAGGRLTFNFNPDWRFIKDDVPGATQPDFNDRQWSGVSTPHTFNDVDTFDDWSLPGHRGEQHQWSGRTWYRKAFFVPPSFEGKKVFIEFEAVRQVAEVYLNGRLLGVSKTGFTPFGFDLTPQIRFGATNVLAVMCDNRFVKDPLVRQDNVGDESNGKGENGGPTLGQMSARVNAAIPENVDQLQANQIPWNNPHWHPAHGGIYRNVRLIVTDPVHITLPLYSFLQTTGPYVYATDVSNDSARICLEVPVQNDRASTESVALHVSVLDHDGNAVLTLKRTARVGAGANHEFKVDGLVETPRLWEPAYPHLYRAVCSLAIGGSTVDTCEIPFGIRSVHWDVQRGFFINGHHLKLHGWGQKPTDEWPGLGAAQPDWMHFFTLNLMKEAGGNFVRWGHCAGGPASIAAADRLGIILEQPGVDGESDTRGAAWKVRASAFRDTIIYFRNDPSILIWEGGNQKVTSEHARELRGLMDQYDPHGGRAYAHRRADRKTAEFMDVCIGTEGGHEIASLPVVEGEYDREESPRRVWDDLTPPDFGYPIGPGQTYRLTSEQYAVNQVSQYVRKLGAPDHCGGANWIFSDSTSGGRVATEVARVSGEVDGVRLPKEAYYVCRTMFRSDPQVYIIGHWNYPARTKKTVRVVSNCDSVGLFLNGKSLGHGARSDRFLFTFAGVEWEPGELKAVAYDHGESAASAIKRTAGPAVALRLMPITGPGGLQADGSDVALIDVEAVDARGRRCPTFQQRVDFSTQGPGVWRGGYDSGKTNSINNLFLDLECGINRVSVRSERQPGTITVRARSAGLQPAVIQIPSHYVEVTAGLGTSLPELPSVSLPEERIIKETSLPALPSPTEPRASQQVGRYTRTFSYSGPAAIVHVEQNAQPGKNIYVDRDIAMPELPPPLAGADWVQAANADSRYDAADLMEISVPAGTVVSVAHDDRLPQPGWLKSLFKPGPWKIMVDGHSCAVYQRQVREDESLTLGSNVEASGTVAAEMYVVFIAPDPAASGKKSLTANRADTN